MYLHKPFQLLRYVLLALLLAPAIPAMSIPHESISDSPYDNMIVHDARGAAPEGFVYVGNLSDDKIVDLELGMRGSDTPGLVKRLYEISTPGSSSYGKYLSKEEAESYARPTDDALRKVSAWLTYYGVQSKIISPSGDRLQITLPISKANKMLHAKFSTFRHAATGTESFQALSYSLPYPLNNMIESVEPTTSFPNPASRPATQAFTNSSNWADSTCEEAITPDCLIKLYGIPTTRATQRNNVLSVPGFGEEYANRKDLASFLGDFRKDLHGASFTDQSIDGGKNPQDPGTAGAEANLDIQYTVSLVNFAPVVFLSSGLNTINGFINVTNYWLNQDHPPTVVSISYGFLESVLGIKSAFILCNLYAQLSSRGVSILVSSGDGGVAGSQPGECTDGKFRPDFPASCPFVTTVGATGGFHTEVAAKLSAGGFSDFFYQPNYQAAAVDGYLSQIGSLYHGLFNRTGRAYPDISAQGDDRKIVTIINQIKYPSGGTSASTPIVASIVTLLNDRLIKRGRPVLGFLNPWLYANQKALNNITSGSNPGCNTDGFPAKAGWNPVTGLGTPSFPRMAEAIRV